MEINIPAFLLNICTSTQLAALLSLLGNVTLEHTAQEINAFQLSRTR